MEKIFLKDGKEARIDIWGYNELNDYVSVHGKGSKKTVKGFSFLTDVAVQNLLYRGNPMFSGKNLSPMEKQELSGVRKEYYVRSIVATIDDELAGLFVCNWAKDNCKPNDMNNKKEHAPFWRYYAEFMEVNEKYRNQGIGTSLISSLNESYFLKNKILQLSIYTDCGSAYAKPSIEKYLKAEKYALIPHDYSVENPPKKPGIYDKFGNMIR